MQQRPAGVTVLSILQFLGAAFSLLAALAMFLGGGAVAAALAGSGREGGALGGGVAAIIMGVGGIFFLVMTALWLATAIGMWKLKGWGRWMTIVFTGIAALFAVLGLLLSLIHFNPLLFAIRVVFLAIYALILWYMFTPEVQRAFAAK